jgi:hypothetical protein
VGIIDAHPFLILINKFAKMKIETIVKSCANNTVKYSNGIRVVYDAKAVAEVSEKDGEFLLERYAGQIFPEGKVVKPVIVPSKSNSVDGSEAETLRAQLQKANALINDYKAQANTSKDNERVWRTKCQDLMLENHSLKDLLGQPVKAEEKLAEIATLKPPEADKVIDVETEDAVIREKLTKKTIKELTAIVEGMKLPVEEYKMLNKNKLVDYIIAKTTNAT